MVRSYFDLLSARLSGCVALPVHCPGRFAAGGYDIRAAYSPWSPYFKGGCPSK